MPYSFYNETNDVEIISGAALLFRKDAFKTVGLLDDRLIVNGDDAEWCVRARGMGCRLVFLPEAEVTHIGYASRGFDSSKMHARNIESLFRLYEVLYRWPEPSILKCAMMGNIALTCLRNAVVAPISKKRRERAVSLWKLLVTALRLAFR